MPLNILYVIDGLGPGGAEGSLAEMLPPLRREGIEITIALLNPRMTERWKKLEATGYRIGVLAGRNRAAKLLALRARLRAERPALLHTTLFNADILGRLAAWGTGIPVLTSLVNTTYDRVRLQDPKVSPLGLRAARSVDRWTAVHLTRHFHAITQAVKEAAVRDLALPPERITVVERGRDPAWLGRRTEARRQRARAMLGLAPEAEVVIHVGRQDFQKGLRYLIQAMDLLGKERPALVLVMAGRPGHETEELLRLVNRSHYRNRIRLLGYREEIPELLAAADLFVFPSLYEGLGGALIEAMALSLPIVASDLPVFRDVLEPGGNALLVERGSAVALAGAIRALLDDPARSDSFGQRSRQIFEERFRLEKAVHGMASLYRSLGKSRAAEDPPPTASLHYIPGT